MEKAFCEKDWLKQKLFQEYQNSLEIVILIIDTQLFP